MTPFALLLSWLVVFIVLHVLIVPISLRASRGTTVGRFGERVWASASPPQAAYIRRCLRSLVYSVLATLAGLSLLPRDFASVHASLHRYTDWHSVWFNMALAHWVLAIYEDIRAWRCLSLSFSNYAIQTMGIGRSGASAVLCVVYVWHHLWAAFAFLNVQSSRELASMTTLGLLFEVPVMFSTVRELVATFNADHEALRHVNRTAWKMLWQAIFSTFFLFRGGASAVFGVYAVFLYRFRMVAEVGWWSRVTFWLLGGGFSLFNLYWLSLMLMFSGADTRAFQHYDVMDAKARGEPLPQFGDNVMAPRAAATAMTASGVRSATLGDSKYGDDPSDDDDDELEPLHKRGAGAGVGMGTTGDARV